MSNNCTAVTPECPVEISIYGYYPSVPANAFFLAWFAVLCVGSAGLGVWFRTWTYAVAVSLGCMTEAIGYGGRLMLHSNPFGNGFIVQICCLIIAPAFNSAAIYLTLKHVTLCFGAESSVIKPRFYTYIFICADLLSLVLQAIGGALASTADTNSQESLGNDLMMAGIAWQVASLFFFAVMAGLYLFRRYRALAVLPLSREATVTLADTKFRLFAFGVGSAWLTIFARCVYRIIEMAGGWGNSIMRDETDFIVLEGAMIAWAAAVQTIIHPGFCFPRLSSRWTPSEYAPTGSSENMPMKHIHTDGENLAAPE